MFKNFDLSKIQNFEPAPGPAPDTVPSQQPAEPDPASPPSKAAPVDFSEYEFNNRVSQNRIDTIQIQTLTGKGV
jgi:hypothetical protein